jgi:hypothetical protein
MHVLDDSGARRCLASFRTLSEVRKRYALRTFRHSVAIDGSPTRDGRRQSKMREDDYRREFGIDPPNPDLRKRALEHALDIRKFEIALYWQRAAYFWALIAIAAAGYFLVLGQTGLPDSHFLAFVVANAGFVFTWAWFLVNRGSKFWQENWENHVDMLEDGIVGPLYKTVLHRPQDPNLTETWVTGPLPISTSKINQWVSVFALLIWVVLLVHAAQPLSLSDSLSCTHITVLLVAASTCGAMYFAGRTYQGDYHHIAKKRTTKIE